MSTKFWLNLVLLLVVGLAHAEEASLANCISYSTLEDGDGSVTYYNPKMHKFHDVNETQAIQNQIGSDDTNYLKLIDPTTIYVNDAEEISPEAIIEAKKLKLDEYSYINQSKLISLGDAFARFSLLCYLPVNAANVPRLNDFQVMIKKNINEISEEEFDKLGQK